MIFKTKRFLLRPFNDGDEASLVKNLNNEKITRNLLRVSYPYKLSHAKRWVDFNKKLDQEKTKKEINWVIEIENEVAGSVGFTNMKGHKVEVAYWLAEKYWGQGIMPEAVKIVTEYAFKKLKVVKVCAEVFTFNESSKRVLEKAGFKYEGLLRKEKMKEGKFYDTWLFSKLDTD